MQSPKSGRKHAALERSSMDNLPMQEQGGITGQQGPPERGPQVPKLNFNEGPGFKGGVEAVPPKQTAAMGERMHPGGGPSMAERGDAMRNGGTVERFATNRGSNS